MIKNNMFKDMDERSKLNNSEGDGLSSRLLDALVINNSYQGRDRRKKTLYEVLGISGPKNYRKVVMVISRDAFNPRVLGYDTPTEAYVDGSTNMEKINTLVHESLHGQDRHNNKYGMRTERQVREDTIEVMGYYEEAA